MNKVYHVSKSLLAFAFTSTGIANLAGLMEGDMSRLGYQNYFSIIIGVAFIIAVICIYQTKVKFLQEWAYGGIAITIVGAFASHFFLGDPLSKNIPALLLMIIFIISYYSRYKINNES
ncbi:DoxX family protein [Amphritea japonica]|uniref:DoxX family protein n=1 Tax=Amphritea japonica TaxID=452627 RepID=UPI000380B796|nr:DoxX family protein [Amphritea japonica]